MKGVAIHSNRSLRRFQTGNDTNGNNYFVMPDDSWGDDYTYNPAGF